MLTQIINGQILTLRMVEGWSVLISDGKILEVTNSDLAVIGAKVVDAKGMYIIPGFVAMNVHAEAAMILRNVRKKPSIVLLPPI